MTFAVTLGESSGIMTFIYMHGILFNKKLSYIQQRHKKYAESI